MNDKGYTWPDLSKVIRQYVVADDQGRFGIAIDDGCHDGVLFAHPVDVPALIQGDGAQYMTDTAWHIKPDESYSGLWYDNDLPAGPIPPEKLRRITIVQDLGYLLPEWVADQALAGSDQMGHWNYGAKLGKIGGEPPVKGQLAGEMTVEQAEDFAAEAGEPIKARAIRLAATRGDIPGARKVGRDWLITYEGFLHYLDNRPRPGPKKGSKK
jgi:hypothetical protein